MPLRSLFAVHPELLAPVLQIIHRVIATHLIRQTVVKRSEAATGAVTLIQRYGSAANLTIHLRALVLDGVYRTTGEGVTVFHPAPALTSEKVAVLLDKIIARILRVLTRQGHLVEEEGVTYVADAHGIIDPENLLAPRASRLLYLPHRVRAAGGAQSAELAIRSETRCADHTTTMHQRPRFQPACRSTVRRRSTPSA